MTRTLCMLVLVQTQERAKRGRPAYVAEFYEDDELWGINFTIVKGSTKLEFKFLPLYNYVYDY